MTRLVLLIVVAAALLRQGAANSDGPLTHEELLEKLNEDDGLQPNAVGNLLQRTTDKDKPKVILNQFSVGQLLELNANRNVDLCTINELDRRDKICAELEDENDNLFVFCRTKLFNLNSWCAMNSHAIFDACFKGIADFNKKKIIEFANEVKRQALTAVGGTKRSGNDEQNTELVVRRMLETKESWHKVNLKATCTKLLEEVPKRLVFLNDDMFNENFIMKSCKVVALLA